MQNAGKELLLQSGADHAEVMSTPGNPVVYAEKKISPEAPTVLVYGHYDDAGRASRALEQRAFRTCGQRGPDLGTQ